MGKAVVLKLSFDSNNPDLPVLDTVSLIVGRHNNTTRSRTFIATGGTIILPEGISISDNLLPSTDTNYNITLKNTSRVTNLVIGSDITNFKTDWFENFPLLEELQTLSANNDGTVPFILTGDTTFAKYCPNLSYFKVSAPENLTGNIADFGSNLQLTYIAFSPIGGGGEWLDFVAKQISNGRTSASSITCYFCTRVTFNGQSLGAADRTLSWSNVSSNIYQVSFGNVSTVQIQVNSDGSYTVVQ